MKNSIVSVRSFLAGCLICVVGMQTCAAQSISSPNRALTDASFLVGESGPEITIPAGTRIVLALISPLHTVSASAESGLYAETVFDVIGQHRAVIPVRTQVHGLVTRGMRPGRVKGRAQLQFHFTDVILPGNYVLPISGSLESLPGSSRYEKKQEGIIQPVDQIDKDAATIVASAAGGTVVGALAHGTVRTGLGATIGAGFGLGKVLFKRGDDIRLPEGTRIEMVLDRSVSVQVSKLTFSPTGSEVALPKQPVEEAENSSRQTPKKQPSRGWESILFPN